MVEAAEGGAEELMEGAGGEGGRGRGENAGAKERHGGRV